MAVPGHIFSQKLPAQILELTMLGLACIPARWIPILSQFLLLIAGPLLRKEAQKTFANIHLIYSLPPRSAFAKSFVRQVLRNQFIIFMENLKVGMLGTKVTIDGEEEFASTIASACTEGKGLIVTTSHLGSWEMFGMLSARHFPHHFHALAKPGHNPDVNRFIERNREKMGMRVLWTNRQSLLKDMMTALHNRECVGFVMDQKSKSRKGHLFQFFGHEAEFVKGPAAMAIRCGTPVLSGYCVRTGPLRYRVGYKLFSSTEVAAAGELELTRLLVEQMESSIRMYPEQWTWNYKRWKVKAAKN